MLRITKVEISNFGPYKELETIEFPAQNGVTVVYGENMQGKTSLLNAIRYALYGKVLGRGSKIQPFHKYSNEESAQEGRYGFKVTLYFQCEGHNYDLTRECTPKPGVSKPKADYDYDEKYFLRKNNSAMGPDDATRFLARVMPEKVSRFFLFDGELLQEYEELVSDDTPNGPNEIKKSIERILGVPILVNAHSDLGHFHTEAQKLQIKAAQRNTKTQIAANHQSQFLEQLEHHKDELRKMEAQLSDVKEKQADQEDLIKRNEKSMGLLEQRDKLELQKTETQTKLEERQNKLKQAMSEAWLSMLAPTITSERDELQTRINDIRARSQDYLTKQSAIEKHKAAMQHGECPTCLQKLDKDAGEKLTTLIEELEKSHVDVDLQELDELEPRLHSLKQIQAVDQKKLIQQLFEDIEEYKTQIAETKREMGEIDDQTKNIDESEVRLQYSRLREITQEVAILQKGISDLKKAAEVTAENLKKAKDELSKHGGQDFQKEQDRENLAARLEELFQTGIDVYRDRLKEKVEKDATDLFLKLTTQKEYKGLKINDNYGLTIIHKDGKPIAIRSAGAEHVVALSLMGALQRNAPLRGPIIADSPFGRLDSGHKTNVVKTLPDIADQVALLVFRSELEPTMARELLQGSLRSEYKIVQRTARHSKLKKGLED
ncbi:MAG: AAA family ATPase [Candidatus Obscuribacterales bacterium]|nr:AAA family ATPase [Candidatus Obscuribacterales bacterium]MBY0552051.1 AAA family ATPase [Candidatus Obscuribacterales bacterium]